MTGHVTVEFTIEPFVDGEPPSYVTAAVAAVESLGYTVDVGPFGSQFTTPSDAVAGSIAALVEAAYSHGATHVTIHSMVDGPAAAEAARG